MWKIRKKLEKLEKNRKKGKKTFSNSMFSNRKQKLERKLTRRARIDADQSDKSNGPITEEGANRYYKKKTMKKDEDIAAESNAILGNFKKKLKNNNILV